LAREPCLEKMSNICKIKNSSSFWAFLSQAMIMVWRRKSGDRIIAEVLMYSDLVAVKSAIFEDCEICP
jgi:hypothetical protein